MTTLLDALMGREYDRHRYNCAHFAAEVWRLETGEELLPLLTPLMDPRAPRVPRELGLMFRSHDGVPGRGVRAIVVMRRAGSASHVGVFLRGRVLHLHERGPEFLPPAVASRGFETVTYYVRRDT